MMKKTLAISSQSAVLDSELRSQLQGHCFGFSLYCLFKQHHSEQPILKKNVLTGSKSLQTRYDENKQNEEAIIVLPGVIERQGAVVSVDIYNQDGLWHLGSFSKGLLDRGPCIFYFAGAGMDEGHTLYLDPGDSTRNAVISDTHDPHLHTSLPTERVPTVLSEKIIRYFSSRNPKATSGEILLQTICYEKT